jgi:23S rRNA (cytidine1920-2'-O)/16S rRNA (cytidine1409-2'-O)-methyltransferase
MGVFNIRIDKYLATRGMVESREKARRLIKEGKVLVDNNKILKPSLKVDENNKIDLLGKYEYVGRGAFKLKKAIESFKLNLKDKVCLDIGSSTGGFSQVLLEKGVEKIYSIDVGTNQMHKRLRNNEKIMLKENTNARDYINEEKVDFICCDVSFISVTKMMDTFQKNLKKNGEMVILIKPQFEVGKDNVVNGIVRDKKILQKTLQKVERSFEKNNFKVMNKIESPIKGSKGNTEFLFYIKREILEVSYEI